MNKVMATTTVPRKAGYMMSFLGVRGEFVLPLERLEQVVQHLRQAPVSSPARIRLTNHLVECLRVLRHAPARGLAALDAFDHAGDDFAEARIFDAVAQVREAFDQGTPARASCSR
jgi:hypothetical protein